MSMRHIFFSANAEDFCALRINHENSCFDFRREGKKEKQKLRSSCLDSRRQIFGSRRIALLLFLHTPFPTRAITKTLFAASVCLKIAPRCHSQVLIKRGGRSYFSFSSSFFPAVGYVGNWQRVQQTCPSLPQSPSLNLNARTPQIPSSSYTFLQWRLMS